MNTFLQVLAAVMVAVVLGLALSKQSKDMHMLLGVAVCCLVLVAALSYLEPVVAFVNSLRMIGNLDEETFSIMLKAIGVGIIAQIASLICTDSGNSAMGKTVQILASAVILWLSLPLMRALLELIQKVVGEI